jgi:hypothetical protein
MKKPQTPSKKVIVEELQAKQFDQLVGFAAGLQRALNLITETNRQNPHLTQGQVDVLQVVAQAIRDDKARITGK